jgi:hypothetical protein
MGGNFFVPVERSAIFSDLSQYVAPPEVGSSPYEGRQAYPGFDVFVTAKWFEIEGKSEKPVTDRFEEGKIYKDHITLKIKDPAYYFDETESFRYRDIEQEPRDMSNEVGPDERKFEVTFERLPAKEPPPPDKVREYNLLQYMPVPVTGDSPVKSMERPDFDIQVSWWEDGKSWQGTVFESEKTYRAEITVVVKEGYIFDGGCPFKYPDGTVGVQPGDKDALAPDTRPNKRTILVTFLPTAGLP